MKSVSSLRMRIHSFQPNNRVVDSSGLLVDGCEPRSQAAVGSEPNAPADGQPAQLLPCVLTAASWT